MYENNNTYCLQCNIEKGYYPLYNDNSFCFNNETIKKGYYLDKSVNPFIWRKCYNKCEAYNLFITPDGDCVSNCPNETYKYTTNNSCLKSCPDDYIVYHDECN